MERYLKSTSEETGSGRNTPKEKRPKENPWGRGGYFAAKNRKIRKQAPKPRTQLLNGVTIYFTGVVSQSQHQLTRLVNENGGVVSYGWARRSVTHVVADRLAASKIEKELQVRGSNAWRGSIVKPEWLLSSIEQGRKLPISDYEVITSRQRQGGDLRKLFAKKAQPASSSKRE